MNQVNTILLIVVIVILVGGGMWWYMAYGPGAPEPSGLQINVGESGY